MNGPRWALCVTRRQAHSCQQELHSGNAGFRERRFQLVAAGSYSSLLPVPSTPFLWAYRGGSRYERNLWTACNLAVTPSPTTARRSRWNLHRSRALLGPTQNRAKGKFAAACGWFHGSSCSSTGGRHVRLLALRNRELGRPLGRSGAPSGLCFRRRARVLQVREVRFSATGR